MKARYVIHTVGPVYPQCRDDCERVLSNAYANSMRRALELGCESIAFPAISTGIYGYPQEEAAKIAYRAVKAFDSEKIAVFFIFHSADALKIFRDAVQGC